MFLNGPPPLHSRNGPPPPPPIPPLICCHLPCATSKQCSMGIARRLAAQRVHALPFNPVQLCTPLCSVHTILPHPSMLRPYYLTTAADLCHIAVSASHSALASDQSACPSQKYSQHRLSMARLLTPLLCLCRVDVAPADLQSQSQSQTHAQSVLPPLLAKGTTST